MSKIRNFLCFFICSFHLNCPTTEEQISLSLPTKANGCHNHLKLKTNALFCYFLPF